MTETAVTHRCPPGKQTMRAERVAMMTAPGYGRNFPEKVQRDLANHIAENLAHMREHGLCDTCGYPLDGSYPHPDSQQARWDRGRR